VTKSLQIVLLAAVLTPSAVANWDKGLEAQEAGDIKTAFEEWSASAEKGHAESQYNVGLMYLKGAETSDETVVEKDTKQAIRMITLAAAQGHQDAIYYIGIFYTGDFGIPRDLDQAYCWFEKAARSGYARGYFALGKMNFEGMGRERDLVKAHAFLSLGQAMGHDPSKTLLDQVLEQLTDLSQVEDSIEFINEWGAPDASIPKCQLPGIGETDGS
jgi:TPR repeat protein